MKHKGCKGLIMEHKQNKNKHSSCIACILFETYDCEPFGSFVSYIAVHQQYTVQRIVDYFGAYPVPFGNKDLIKENGIARKLLNLVQFISWVLVRNTSLNLCANQASREFYANLGFEENDIDTGAKFDIPPRVKQSLLNEGIDTDNHDMERLYPMYLKNKILVVDDSHLRNDMLLKLHQKYHPIATNLLKYNFKQSNVFRNNGLLIEKISDYMVTKFEDYSFNAQNDPKISISEHDVSTLDSKFQVDMVKEKGKNLNVVRKVVNSELNKIIREKVYVKIGTIIKGVMNPATQISLRSISLKFVS